MDAALVLRRLLELVGESRDYFVTGSLSFLPLVGRYRAPDHDVDAAVARPIAAARLQGAGSVRQLGLWEVALAGDRILGRLLPVRTAWVHVEGPGGLLDLALYERRRDGLSFSLGAGLTLRLPSAVEGRVRELEWDGVGYRAAPVELAFVPKAAAHVRGRSERTRDEQDLRRLLPLVDWQFVAELVGQGGVFWLGRKLPGLLDPFQPRAIMALQRCRI